MADSLDEILDALERLTGSLLTDSAGAGKCDLADVAGCLQQRATLLRQLSACLAASPPVNYTDYNRLVIVHFQGGQIEANLRKIRSGIAADLSCGARDRLYAERIADQLPRKQQSTSTRR